MEYNYLDLKQLTILFIEDDVTLLKKYTETLKIFFSEVFCAFSGKNGFELYEDKRPNIILLDLSLPDIDGFSIIKKIRENDCKTPIIILSGHSDVETLLTAANSKIDGYLVKPIILEELLVKLLNALRRNGHKVSCIKFKNGIEVNFDTKEIISKENQTVLRAKEQQLLELFIENRNKVLTKEEIMDTIWPIEDVTESAFKNLLNRFRCKVGEDVIISYKSIGWRLNTEIIEI